MKQVKKIWSWLKSSWSSFWMRWAGVKRFGRFATRLASWPAPGYKKRLDLAKLSPKGYVSPQAIICHDRLTLGRHVFIGDRVTIYQAWDGGAVEIGDESELYSDIIIETGQGGSVQIGKQTYIQPRCQLSAYLGSILIGERVNIAPNCAFYPYNHQTVLGEPILHQPLVSKGNIVIEDDAWLGVGVIVLDGVRIGNGAVIGAGSVVTHSIPDNMIAAGVPAKIIKMREYDAIKQITQQ